LIHKKQIIVMLVLAAAVASLLTVVAPMVGHPTCVYQGTGIDREKKSKLIRREQK
jgi:hypothetical protein